MKSASVQLPRLVSGAGVRFLVKPHPMDQPTRCWSILCVRISIPRVVPSPVAVGASSHYSSRVRKAASHQLRRVTFS
jgi:hypothetical protein